MKKNGSIRPADSRTTLILLCASILLAAVTVVTLLFLYPRIRAGKELGRIRASLEDGVTGMVLTDPISGRDAVPAPGETEELAGMLRAALRSARYAGKSDAESGNWDVRAACTLPDGSRVLLYLTADGELYFSRGITRFYFRPAETAFADRCFDLLSGDA